MPNELSAAFQSLQALFDPTSVALVASACAAGDTGLRLPHHLQNIPFLDELVSWGVLSKRSEVYFFNHERLTRMIQDVRDPLVECSAA